MKPIFLLTALAISLGASAECYYSSSTMARVKDQIDGIDSVNYMYGQGRCTITARVQYHGQWHSIAGVAENAARPQQELCLDAMEMGIRDFIIKQTNRGRTDAVQQLVCTDLPTPKVRPVQKGEIIKLSEVQPHPVREPFPFNGNECRWFVEGVAQGTRFKSINGVICRVGRLDEDRWMVVDKNLD